jgi:hypothetical protein
MPPTCVREVECSDLVQDTEYPEGFLAFTPSFQGRKITDITMGKSGFSPLHQEETFFHGVHARSGARPGLYPVISGDLFQGI